MVQFETAEKINPHFPFHLFTFPLDDHKQRNTWTRDNSDCYGTGTQGIYCGRPEEGEDRLAPGSVEECIEAGTAMKLRGFLEIKFQG